MPASALGILGDRPIAPLSSLRARTPASSAHHPDIDALVAKLNDPERWLLRRSLRLVAGTSRRSIFGVYSRWSILSTLSFCSMAAALSLLSVAGLLSAASVASVASVGSVGSVASIGSVFSIRCVGGFFEICL